MNSQPTGASLIPLLDALRRLTFPPTSAALYAWLAVGGPQNAARLRATVDVEARDVRTALAWLTNRRLVARRRIEGETRFYVVEPGVAISALVTDVVWRHISTLEDVHALPPTADDRVEALRAAADEAMGILRRSYVSVDGVRGSRNARAHEPRALAVLSVEAVRLARDEVRAASRRPRLPDVAFFWGAITTAMSHGVAYRRVTDVHEIVEHGLDVVSRDTSETGVDLRVTEPEHVSRGFYVIDRDYVVLHDVADGNDRPAQGGRLTSNGHEIERRRKQWDRLYERAIPADVALAQFRLSSGRLLDRVDPADEPLLRFVRRLVAFGKFADPPESAALLRRAVRLGLVRLNYTGHPIPAYDIDADVLRKAASA